MSIPKYRLASPVDHEQNETLYKQPPSASFSSRPVRLPNLNAVKRKRDKLEETLSPKSSPRWWLVLPYLVLIMLVLASDPLLMNDLIIRRYRSRYGLETSSTTHAGGCQQPTTTPRPNSYWQYLLNYQQPRQAQPDVNQAQRDAAKFNIKVSLITLAPALATYIFLGSNCDFIGRRPLLVLPLFGKVISYSLMLVIVTRDLSDTWILLTQMIEEIFGSIGLVMLSAFGYITDCTQGSMRTRAFLLTEGLMVLTRIVSMLAVGFWLRYYLYTVPFSVCLGLSVIALLYALFLLPESVESV